MKINRLKSCTTKVAICSELGTERTNAFRGQTIEFLGTFAKLRKATVSFNYDCPSVRPHGTTRLPLDRFSWNLVLEHFFRKSVEKIQVSS
jgi:hypothetical protein